MEILKSLESLAESSLYWAENLKLSMLTLFAILECFHILSKAISSVQIFTYGVPFHGVDYLMNPFAPFLRTMDRNCEIMQLNNPVSSVPNQPLLEAVPPKLVRDSLCPTERIVATQEGSSFSLEPFFWGDSQ